MLIKVFQKWYEIPDILRCPDYNVMSHNLKCMSWKAREPFVNPTIMNSHQIFNNGHFQVFLSVIGSYCFTLMLLQICFFFKEIHLKSSDRYSGRWVFDNFKIIRLNWVRISKTNGKPIALMFCFPDITDPLFSSPLSCL